MKIALIQRALKCLYDFFLKLKTDNLKSPHSQGEKKPQSSETGMKKKVFYSKLSEMKFKY